MIFLLYGTDNMQARKKLNDLIDKLLSRKPDAMLIRITYENFDKEQFLNTIDSQGLFESHSIIVLDSVFKNPEGKETVLDSLKELSESGNIFVVLEEKIDKKTLTKISKHSEKVQEFTELKIKEEKSFNIFLLSDAIGERNKKKLWTLYIKGKMNNISDEEMHGILFWSCKSMLLAQCSDTAKEAGLNPFVFKKNERFAKNYSEDDLKKLSSRLVNLYHDARRGIEPLDTALERFILTL